MALQPPTLNAFVNYVDLDPLGPVWGQTALQLLWIPTVPHYFGTAETRLVRFELAFAKEPTPNIWRAKLNVFGWWVGPDPFVYSNIFVDPSKPFGTDTFGDTVIPGSDFRLLQIME